MDGVMWREMASKGAEKEGGKNGIVKVMRQREESESRRRDWSAASEVVGSIK